MSSQWFSAYDTFSQTNHSLQSFAVLFDAVSAPGSDVPCQDVLSGAGVEIPQYLRRYLEFSQVSEVASEAAPRSGSCWILFDKRVLSRRYFLKSTSTCCCPSTSSAWASWLCPTLWGKATLRCMSWEMWQVLIQTIEFSCIDVGDVYFLLVSVSQSSDVQNLSSFFPKQTVPAALHSGLRRVQRRWDLLPNTPGKCCLPMFNHQMLYWWFHLIPLWFHCV